MSEPIDVVFTWVDDQFPGYTDQLRAYASDKHDTNPNRTRDNLESLRFGLRSVERYLPQVRRVYLLTCRPQVPPWLDQSQPDLMVVHHDQIMDPAILPTFNSFAIMSHLHLLPGIGERFLLIEDDMMLMKPGILDALQPGGKPMSFFGAKPLLELDRLDPARESPWNMALANTSAALAKRFSAHPRRTAAHLIQMIRRDDFAEIMEMFADEVAVTRASRFRAANNIAPEFLYPQAMAELGRAEIASPREWRRTEGYASLENIAFWTWLQLKMIELKRPVAITLNDSFEDQPNQRVEKMVRAWLERQFPEPSRFELADTA